MSLRCIFLKRIELSMMSPCNSKNNAHKLGLCLNMMYIHTLSFEVPIAVVGFRVTEIEGLCYRISKYVSIP